MFKKISNGTCDLEALLIKSTKFAYFVRFKINILWNGLVHKNSDSNLEDWQKRLGYVDKEYITKIRFVTN